MRRVPAVVFAALVVATVGAFFVTQHLKVTTPLIAGSPHPSPGSINPRDGTTCGGVNHRFMRISFYLLHRSDDVAVYIVDQSGAVIRTITSRRHMRRGVRTPDGQFSWNGRRDDGEIAPDGNYYIRVSLIHQGRTVLISNTAGPVPVTVKTVPPHPTVTAAVPHLIPQGGRAVTIHYRGSESHGVTVRLYRTDVGPRPQLAKAFFSPYDSSSTAQWDGRVRGRPAPAGVYLVGLAVTDNACNTGEFPVELPPAPGSTPGAGVSVRYLAGQPPLEPVAAGAAATVFVDSRGRGYRWALRRVGSAKILGYGAHGAVAQTVRLPPRVAGLYDLTLANAGATTDVPLVANATSHPARILVVLPSLTWQGQNPADDDGDGMPNTLDLGSQVQLNRPFADGLPPGFADEAALLAHLDKAHLAYDLTTDLGLLRHVGPTLTGHAAVVFAGSERWVPAALSTGLRGYVQRGGHVLSFGIDSLRRAVTVQGATARQPTGPAGTDFLGARPEPVVRQTSSELITVIDDGLSIFSTTSGAFQGFDSFQPFGPVASPGKIVSAAGATSNAPSIIGYRLGRGVVVDVGLPGFGASTAHNLDAQELLSRLWSVLGR